MNRLKTIAALLLDLAYVGTACRPYTVSSGRPALAWQPITENLGPLPEAVRVFEGVDDATPLHAWYARIDLGSSDIRPDILVSDDADGRETVSDLTRSTDACVAVNGGYFISAGGEARHIGLLVSARKVLRSATNGIFVDDIRYPTARAALGFFESGDAKVAWVTSSGDSVLAWPAPPPNTPGRPSSLDVYGNPEVWPAMHAVAAGPSLVRNGHTLITSDEEIFFNTPIPNVHPRTAAGIDADGSLLLLVVDGRQTRSRGVSLEDLAAILEDLGAVDALNLDGGGSSSFVVNGRLLNRPAGSPDEREVVSSVAIHCPTVR